MMSTEARGIDLDTTVSRVRICLLSALDPMGREDNESCRCDASGSSSIDFSLVCVVAGVRSVITLLIGYHGCPL